MGKQMIASLLVDRRRKRLPSAHPVWLRAGPWPLSGWLGLVVVVVLVLVLVGMMVLVLVGMMVVVACVGLGTGGWDCGKESTDLLRIPLERTILESRSPKEFGILVTNFCMGFSFFLLHSSPSYLHPRVPWPGILVCSHPHQSCGLHPLCGRMFQMTEVRGFALAEGEVSVLRRTRSLAPHCCYLPRRPPKEKL